MSSGQLFDFALIGFGGVFCLVWGVGLLMRSGERRVLAAGIAFVLLSGWRLTWEAWLHSGLAWHSPALYALPIPVLYAIGPILYYYYRSLGDPSGERIYPTRLHFFPAALATLPLAIWLSADAETQRRMMTALLESGPGRRSFAEWAFLIWIVGPKVSIFAYSLWIPLRRQAEGFNAAASLDSELRWFSRVLLVYVYAMILVDIGGYLAGLPSLFRASAWSHALAAVIVYWYAGRRPDALLEFEVALERGRYERSKLGGVAVDATLARLERLMVAESLYADEDLRLAGLAKHCDLSPHQLSELLNDQLGLSFSKYVNRHRVQAAAKMLRAEPERTVLSIAMAVGFQSKSAFHRAFRAELGKTPVEFRGGSDL